MISQAASLLSRLSTFAGVVLAPRRASTFRQIEFLRLSERRVLLIIVSAEGDVQNRILSVERDHSPTTLIEAANFINMHYAGVDFEEIKSRLRTELVRLQQDISTLMQRALEAGSEAAHDQSESLVLAGERNFVGLPDFAANMSRLKELFGLFEKRTDLLQLLDASVRAHGVQIYIGGESDLVPMEELSVVTAPYEVDGQVVGTLGVIGPTRMAYQHMIPIVDITAKLVSSALNQSSKASLIRRGNRCFPGGRPVCRGVRARVCLRLASAPEPSSSGGDRPVTLKRHITHKTRMGTALATVTISQVKKVYGIDAGHPRRRRRHQPTASSACWSDRPGAASRRCCG